MDDKELEIVVDPEYVGKELEEFWGPVDAESNIILRQHMNTSINIDTKKVTTLFVEYKPYVRPLHFSSINQPGPIPGPSSGPSPGTGIEPTDNTRKISDESKRTWSQSPISMTRSPPSMNRTSLAAISALKRMYLTQSTINPPETTTTTTVSVSEPVSDPSQDTSGVQNAEK